MAEWGITLFTGDRSTKTTSHETFERARDPRTLEDWEWAGGHSLVSRVGEGVGFFLGARQRFCPPGICHCIGSLIAGWRAREGPQKDRRSTTSGDEPLPTSQRHHVTDDVVFAGWGGPRRLGSRKEPPDFVSPRDLIWPRTQSPATKTPVCPRSSNLQWNCVTFRGLSLPPPWPLIAMNLSAIVAQVRRLPHPPRDFFFIIIIF